MILVLKSHQQHPVRCVLVPAPMLLSVGEASLTNWSRVKQHADSKHPMAGLTVRHVCCWLLIFMLIIIAATQPIETVIYDTIVCPVPASINYTRLVS